MILIIVIINALISHPPFSYIILDDIELLSNYDIAHHAGIRFTSLLVIIFRSTTSGCSPLPRYG